MNTNNMLTTASLISILLFVFHLADDIVIGIEPGGLTNLIGGTLIAVVWLCGTLLLRGRLLGYIITLIGGLFAAVIPYLHMSGKGVGGEFAKAPGAYFFIVTLLALAVTGTFSVILSALGIWNLRSHRAEPRDS